MLDEIKDRQIVDTAARGFCWPKSSPAEVIGDLPSGH